MNTDLLCSALTWRFIVTYLLAMQAQTVVADNLGLAVAICVSQFVHQYPRVERILPFAMYPFMASVELYAIFQQLGAVHLQTLNKVCFPCCHCA